MQKYPKGPNELNDYNLSFQAHKSQQQSQGGLKDSSWLQKVLEALKDPGQDGFKRFRVV